MDYFTSDTHYGHRNIIDYCKRPFASVEDMNTGLVDNINKKVKENDRLFHLGDWSMGGKDNAKEFRDRIACKNIILILGNHDRPRDTNFMGLFSAVYPIYEYKGQNKRITLCHYAMKIWNKSNYGAYHLYGHSHGSLPDDKYSLSFDIGMDCHNYQVLSFKEVEDIMFTKEYKPVDHHNEKTT